MARLSVNVNKVATLRNSRGGDNPNVIEAVGLCLQAGARGITIHPREDERHIRTQDIFDIAAYLSQRDELIELNVEGDPRPDLVNIIHKICPSQCTLVPVMPGEITSQAGWPSSTPHELLKEIIISMKEKNIRVSLFIDADQQAIEWAADVGANRVELYTEPYARAFEQGEEKAKASFEKYVQAARYAHQLGLGINAGHDLDLANLILFKQLPYLEEVSIGHAIISRALFMGLSNVVKEYLSLLAE